jgi:hypothetical protein
MTPEERGLLTDLANKISQTPPPPIDKEAEEFIRTRIGSRPDALYLMTQTVLVQNLALQQAQQQIQQLQQNASASGSQGSSSFLGRTTGTTAPMSAPPQTGYAGAPGSGQAYQAPPPAASPSGGSSFLRSAAQTAAGVAAGALAFEGIRSLFGGMGGFGEPHLGSGFLGGGLAGSPGEETVINNYYDSPQDDRLDTGHDLADNQFEADDLDRGADAGDNYDDASSDTGDDYSGGDDFGDDLLS